MSKKYCKICGNKMVLGHFGYYCNHDDLHLELCPLLPYEAKCKKETITINKEDYEAMIERDETLIKKNIEFQKQLLDTQEENQKLKGWWQKLQDDLMLFYTVGSTSDSYGYDAYKSIFDRMKELEKEKNNEVRNS